MCFFLFTFPPRKMNLHFQQTMFSSRRTVQKLRMERDAFNFKFNLMEINEIFIFVFLVVCSENKRENKHWKERAFPQQK